MPRVSVRNNNIDAALTTVNRGLEADDERSDLYQLKADILLQNNPEISNLESAKELYLIAIEWAKKYLKISGIK